MARSIFYRWFDDPLEQFMAALAERALAYARTQQVDLSVPLGGVTNWYIVDATTMRVRDTMHKEFPGTEDYTAIKAHKVLAVGRGAPVQYHFSPAQEYDSRHLQIDESWRGYGLLADLTNASLARRRACEAHGVRFVMRLKVNWKPKVDDLARGQVTQEFLPGSDFNALLADDPLVLDSRILDADVHVGWGRHALPLRLVGVQTPKGDCFFLTNLPPLIGPRQVADLYHARWEVELGIRLGKSVNRLDAIDAKQPCTLKTLMHASLIDSAIAVLLAHTHNVHTHPQPPGAPRPEAPLHPRRLALQLAVPCHAIAQAFELTGAEAMQRWNTIAELLTHSGKYPNWRRRPSVLDQLRGWKRQLLARRKPNGGHVSNGHVKASA